MRRIFLAVGLGLLLWAWFDQSQSEKIRRIDAKIEELKEKKRGFEGRAMRAENQADRLQFEDQLLLESRRYYLIAEENRLKAQRVQEEIDRLEARKARILGEKR
jgi:FtsZ-binding cell division protein ZapB